MIKELMDCFLTALLILSLPVWLPVLIMLPVPLRGVMLNKLTAFNDDAND